MKFHLGFKIFLSVSFFVLPLVLADLIQVPTFYRQILSDRWPVSAIQYHSTIGYALSPGYSGRLLNNSYSLHTHNLGYRISNMESRQDIQKHGLLAQGCSFTFGDGLEAEQAFPYLSAQLLKIPVYNFGVCSYSYASIILQLQNLEKRGILKILEPQLLVLGVGDWLVARSLSQFYPTGNFPYAYSYIARNSVGQLQIRAPFSFFSTLHAFNLVTYLTRSGDFPSRLGFWDFLRLSVEVPRVVLATIVRNTSSFPRVTSEEVYRFFFQQVGEVINHHNIKVVVLWMPSQKNVQIDSGLVMAIREFPNFNLINGLSLLVKKKVAEEQYLPETGRPFTHPKFLAHKAYALGIAEVAQSLGVSRK